MRVADFAPLLVLLIANQVTAGTHAFRPWPQLPVTVSLHGPASAALLRPAEDAMAEIFAVCGYLLGPLNRDQATPLDISLDAGAVTAASDAAPWAPELFCKVFAWWCDCRELTLAPWLREGAAQYYAWRLGETRGWLDAAASRAFVSRCARAYFGSPRAGGISPEEAGRPWHRRNHAALLRGAGFLAALGLDARLRTRGETLADTLHRLTADRREVGTDDLAQALAAADDPSIQTFIQRHIQGVHFLPAAQDLAAEGFALKVDPIQGLASVDTLTESLPARAVGAETGAVAVPVRAGILPPSRAY